MKRIAIGVLLVLLSVAATAQKPRNCSFGLAKDDVSRFTQQWYSEQLFALGEQCLPPEDSSQRIYRFLWLRTFDHPIVVRLDIHRDGTGNVVARETDGAGGYKPGKLISSAALPVTKEEVDRFLMQLKSAEFFGSAYPDHRGEDGAEWILEANDESRYRMQWKWTPAERDTFRRACLYLFSLSKLELPKDVY